jgi:glutamyl/glutaminyl-tRNA synthetase
MFGFEPPEFAHLPLLLNEKGQKLSKRFGDVSVQSYKDQGYLPEAMVNGLALLGWNPPQKTSSTEDQDSARKKASSNSVFSKHEVLSMDDLKSMVR